jgi:hypothetical protein
MAKQCALIDCDCVYITELIRYIVFGEHHIIEIMIDCQVLVTFITEINMYTTDHSSHANHPNSYLGRPGASYFGSRSLTLYSF